MAKNNYEIERGDYSSPAHSYETDSKNDVSSDTAQRYLLAVRDIVNDCIEKRIKDGQDIARIYTAEVISRSTTDIEVGKVTVGSTQYSVTKTVPSSITVRYNENDYTTISNDTVQILDADIISNNKKKFIKICTYDGVQFYVLHKM